MINWNRDICAAPRDGREVLLAIANTLGTADGGDGVKLHPRWPFLYYLAEWTDPPGTWRTTEGNGPYDIDPGEPCAWAEITPPFASGGIVSADAPIPGLVWHEHFLPEGEMARIRQEILDNLSAGQRPKITP